MNDNKTTIHMVPEPRKSELTKRTLTYCNQKHGICNAIAFYVIVP